ncbi:synaptobrevin-domain-containing protein [Gorgonomyces haynaldii]|nr:synaptobrevin-domain-containing protein [Gorgonomyces haynaldii]
MSYTYDNYFFHLMTRNQITYLCLCDADLGRRRPFLFLEKLASETEQRYGERITNAMVYGLMEFSGQLGTLMDYYSQDQSDSFQTVQTQVDQVKDIMVNNIEKILERGERIDMLVDKTGQLSQQSDQFKKRSTALRRAMYLGSY